MISDLNREKLKIGKKEVLSAIASGEAVMVFLAADCDESISDPIEAAAKHAQIPVETAESRKALGKACGIDVGASCAAKLR